MKKETYNQLRKKHLLEAKRLGWKIRLRADKDGYSVIHPNGYFYGGGSKNNCEEFVLNSL